MARQVLPTLDVRTTEERAGLSESQALAKSLQGILTTIGQAEKVRRERLQLDRVSRAIAGGATTAEAILAASSAEPEFAPGIRGNLQRLVGTITPQGDSLTQGIKQSIISAKLKEALIPALERRGKEADIAATEATTAFTKGPRTKQALAQAIATGQVVVGQGGTLIDRATGKTIARGLPPSPRGGRPIRPTEQTPEQKDVDRDIKVLTDVHASGSKKGELKATPAQQEAAKERLRKGELRDVQPGALDDQYEAEIKGKPKVKVKGTKFDKAFGKEAYEKTLQELKDAALAQGATEASVEADFNRWWDEQAALEDPKGFGRRMIPREEFEGGIGLLSEEELEKLASQVK